ncbi:SIS domain-containing protein [Schleiferiaceae bacterium]|jgi:D-sedoheptulose 7-phosphate isomerase|nr:SIS domain-containing protein [Schleiferiaceae bacterium]MDA8820553.1 SIS domain-containing protein [Schleiferiaceae bacterium]MDB2473316.1 SIS domain-containing protein [Schleiferiaceae bacterium]PSR07948.1 MAG: phosphoheptose isomerase [Bacteroidota bacterium]
MQAKQYIELVKSTLDALDAKALESLVDAFHSTYEKGGNIYTMGNGGSGASASHAAGDFLKGASYGLDKRFRMICLNDNLPSMMAIANDIGWESIFVEPLKNFLSSNDLVIGISGSGNSKNVVNAIEYANEQGATTVAMSGFKGGKISQIATIDVHAPVMDMEVTEDVHMVIFNIVKKQMMARLMGDNPSMGDTYDQRVG